MKNNHGFSNILVISIALVLIGVGGYFGLNYYNNLKITSVKTPVEEKYTEFSFVKFKIPSLNQELITKYLNETKKIKDEGFSSCSFSESDIKNYKINKDEKKFEFEIDSTECPPAFLWIKLSVLPNDAEGGFIKFEGYKTEFENWELLPIANSDLNFYENTTGPRAIGKGFFMIENKNNPNSDRIEISISPASDDTKQELSGQWDYDFAKNLMLNMVLK
jgi:hypothetical protein